MSTHFSFRASANGLSARLAEVMAFRRLGGVVPKMIPSSGIYTMNIEIAAFPLVPRRVSENTRADFEGGDEVYRYGKQTQLEVKVRGSNVTHRLGYRWRRPCVILLSNRFCEILRHS